MIEIVENTVQLSVLLICAGISAVWVIRNHEGTASLLFLFYVSFALADLYSLLYLVFYDQTPVIFYVSDLGWYASYLFLYMLLQQKADPGERTIRHPALWLLPLFCVAMCVFYMQWGDYPGNVICAVLMSLLLYHIIRGLVYMRACPEKAANKRFYITSFLFCVLEYCAWTVSCYWSGDTWANPYFCFDCLMTVCLMLMLLAYRKGQNQSKHHAGSSEAVVK